MSKLPRLSGKEVIRILEHEGFIRLRQRGSHVILVQHHMSGKRTTVVPLHDEIDRGTLLEILRQAGLPKDRLTRP